MILRINSVNCGKFHSTPVLGGMILQLDRTLAQTEIFNILH